MPEVVRPPMGKKTTATDGGEQQPRKITTTKIPAELLRKAKTVAAYRGIDLFDYLVEKLAGVEDDYDAIIRPDSS